MFARSLVAALLAIVIVTAAPTAMAQQTAVPPSWATLPLMTNEAQETEAGLRDLTGDEQLAWIWARNLKALEAADLAGRTWREVSADGAETVTFFRKDDLAFLRPAPDVRRPENAPGIRWQVRDGLIIFPDGGEARHFLADSEKLFGWTLSADGSRIGRFEIVHRDGDLTREKNLPRTVATRPADGLPDPESLPEPDVAERAVGRTLRKLDGETVLKALREAGYRRMEVHEVVGLTVQRRGATVRNRVHYDASGVTRSRNATTPPGVVYELPWRPEFGGLMRSDTYPLEAFFTKDARTGFVVTSNPVSGLPARAQAVVYVGAGNHVDSWDPAGGPLAWTLPLISEQDKRTETLVSVAEEERDSILRQRGFVPLKAADLRGRTIREVPPEGGSEVVTFFSRDGLAYVRPAPDQPRPDAAPGFPWEVRDGLVVDIASGEGTRYMADKARTAGACQRTVGG